MCIAHAQSTLSVSCRLLKEAEAAPEAAAGDDVAARLPRMRSLLSYHSACRLLKESEPAPEAAADTDAADEDDEEDVGENVLIAERTVDRQILDVIIDAGAPSSVCRQL